MVRQGDALCGDKVVRLSGSHRGLSSAPSLHTLSGESPHMNTWTLTFTQVRRSMSVANTTQLLHTGL